MGENSKIQWTDNTFNPWVGCTRVSPACDNCYAANGIFAKFNGVEWGKGTPRHLTGDDNWKKPVSWNRKAAKEGIHRKVFCASLADVFEDHPDLPPWRERLWALIDDTPNLDWLLLTKRPGNIPKMMPEGGFGPNVWLGTTVESQEFAKGRIKQLLRVPAAVHFLSCEPLLGPLDLREWLSTGRLDWVIAGGESGPHARPTDPQWFESLRDQCTHYGVKFHFKQWGEWTPTKPTMWQRIRRMNVPSGVSVFRAGKKTAGRLLGGRTWDGMPAGTVPTVPTLPRSRS